MVATLLTEWDPMTSSEGPLPGSFHQPTQRRHLSVGAGPEMIQDLGLGILAVDHVDHKEVSGTIPNATQSPLKTSDGLRLVEEMMYGHDVLNHEATIVFTPMRSNGWSRDTLSQRRLEVSDGREDVVESLSSPPIGRRAAHQSSHRSDIQQEWTFSTGRRRPSLVHGAIRASNHTM